MMPRVNNKLQKAQRGLSQTRFFVRQKTLLFTDPHISCKKSQRFLSSTRTKLCPTPAPLAFPAAHILHRSPY
jgi:hypothetical protein